MSRPHPAPPSPAGSHRESGWNLGSTNGSRYMATTVWAILSAIVGTPKHADPAAVGLGDLHCSHRGREVRPRAHPVPDPVEVVLQIGLELAQGHLVHPRGALVGRDPPVRLPHDRLGNRKRLVLGLWHVPSIPPGAGAPVDRTGHPW